MFDKFLRNNYETSEYANNNGLMTHFYQNNYDQTLDAVTAALKSLDFVIDNVDNYYNELLAHDKRCEVIITFAKPSYAITTIDIKINCKFVIAAGRPIKILNILFDAFNKRLTLKQIGGIHG